MSHAHLISACDRMSLREPQNPVHLRRKALLELLDGHKEAFSVTQKALAEAFPDSSDAKFPDNIAAKPPQQLKQLFQATLPKK